MDITQIAGLSGVGLISFGGVWIIDRIMQKIGGRPLVSEEKFVTAIAVAFAWGLVPPELGNEIINRFRDAVGVATGMAGFYQLGVRTVERMGA